MKIYIESNDFEEKCLCQVCGRVFIPHEVIARAYNENGDYLSEVCQQCLASGSEGISHNLRQRAESLRLMASALENIARSEIEAPSIEHYLTANQMTRALR